MDLYRNAMKLPAGNAIIPEASDKEFGEKGLREEKPFASRVRFVQDYPFLYYGQLDSFDGSNEYCQLSLEVDLAIYAMIWNQVS